MEPTAGFTNCNLPAKAKMPEIISLKNSRQNQSVQRAANLLAQGEIIIAPTDTLYGMFACAQNHDAVEKIFTLKKRRPDHALPLIAASQEQVGQYVLFSKAEHLIAAAFWPGPLTIVLQARKTHGLVSACVEQGFIAVRVPANTFNREIAAATDNLLTATSTNFSGEKPASCVAEIQPLIKNKVAAVFDAGASINQTASTIIKIENNRLKLLRAGPVSPEQIYQSTGISQ